MDDIELWQGDCLELMKDIPDGSVDMVLCDLPYGTTHNHWDSVIPLDNLWIEYNRIAKNNAAIALFGQDKFMARLMLSNEKAHRYNIVWEKTKAGGFLNAKRMPMVAHEEICIFYKKLPKYNPQFEQGTPYQKKAVTNGDGKNYGKFERVGKINVNDGRRYPRSVIRFANDNHNSLHPTQKPVALLEYLIRTYSNPGELILDNCMGSGSTGVACLNTGRRFIGIELNKDYYLIARDRIEAKRKEIENKTVI